jgi:hypothetical protein
MHAKVVVVAETTNMNPAASGAAEGANGLGNAPAGQRHEHEPPHGDGTRDTRRRAFSLDLLAKALFKKKIYIYIYKTHIHMTF